MIRTTKYIYGRSDEVAFLFSDQVNIRQGTCGKLSTLRVGSGTKRFQIEITKMQPEKWIS